MRNLLVTVLFAFALSSCTSPQYLYSWYDYVDASYQYEKKETPKSEENLSKSIQKVMKKQNGSRKVVPPGIYAENGYMLIKAGKKEEGLSLLKKEIELYPESQVFIGRIVKQIEK